MKAKTAKQPKLIQYEWQVVFQKVKEVGVVKGSFPHRLDEYLKERLIHITEMRWRGRTLVVEHGDGIMNEKTTIFSLNKFLGTKFSDDEFRNGLVLQSKPYRIHLRVKKAGRMPVVVMTYTKLR